MSRRRFAFWMLALVVAGSAVLAGDDNRVSCTFRFTLTAEDRTEGVRLTCVVPRSVHGRQIVESLRFSPPPRKVYEDSGTSYAQFDFSKPSKTTEVAIDADLVIHKYDLSVAQARPERRWLDRGGEDYFKRFLGREGFQESDDPSIVAFAGRAKAGADLDLARGLLASIIEEIRQSPYQPDDRGAIETLKARTGDCTDFTDLFVALCRARGIPARTCEGYLTTDVAKDDTPKHDWAEIHLKDLGWLPVDPFHVELNSAKFESLRPIYILLTTRRNDPVLKNFHYWHVSAQRGTISGSDQFTVQNRRDK